MNLVTAKGCGVCFKVKTLLKKKNIPCNIVLVGESEADRIVKESGLVDLPIIEDAGKYYAGSNAYKYVEAL